MVKVHFEYLRKAVQQEREVKVAPLILRTVEGNLSQVQKVRKEDANWHGIHVCSFAFA